MVPRRVRLICSLVPARTSGIPHMLGLMCSMCGVVRVSVLVADTRLRRMLGHQQSGSGRVVFLLLGVAVCLAQ